MFSYFSQDSKVLSESQKKLRCFFYCLCLFLYFSTTLHIYIIFCTLWTIMKRINVLFSYSSQYTKVIGASWNYFVLFIYVSWVSIILGQCGSTEQFSSSYESTWSFILLFVMIFLRSFVQVKIILSHFKYYLCVFLDFLVILNI